MGLSFFNAERARKAELEKTLEPIEEQISTSPVADGVEVEVEKVEVKEEVQPKPKKKKTK